MRYALAQADLAVTKTGPATAFPGDNLTYTINVTNIGPNDAVNPVVTDTFDANTTYVSSVAPAGWVTTTTPHDRQFY